MLICIVMRDVVGVWLVIDWVLGLSHIEFNLDRHPDGMSAASAQSSGVQDFNLRLRQ